MPFDRMYPDSQLRLGLSKLLVDSVRRAHERNPSGWSVSRRDGGKRVNLVVGRIYVLSFRPDTVYVTLLDDTVDERALEEFREEALESHLDAFKSLPGATWYGLPPERLVTMWPRLRDGHEAAIDVAAAAVGTTPYFQGFSDEVVESIEAEVGESLPRPEFDAQRMRAGLLNRLLALFRGRYPEWSSFEDPRLVSEEIAYKREASEKARELLSREALSSLVQGEEWDEIVSRLETIAQATNLLWLAVPRSGDLSVLYLDGLDRAGFCRAILDLLHGEGDGPERLGRYLDWLEGAGVPDRANKWTFPTYFLFLLDPVEEFFVKPSVTRWFIRVASLDIKLRSNPDAETYAAIRDAALQLREVLDEFDARDMIHVQSFLWTAKLQEDTATKQVDGTLQQIGDEVRAAFERFRADPSSRLRHRIKRRRAGEIQELLSEPYLVDLDTFNREVWALESRTVLAGKDVSGRLDELVDRNDENLRRALETDQLELHGNYMFASGSGVYGSMLVSPPSTDSELGQIIRVLESADEPLEVPELVTRLAAAETTASLADPARVRALLDRHQDLFTRSDDGRYRLLQADDVRIRNVREALSILDDGGMEPIEKAREIMEIPGFGRNAATGLVMIFHPDDFAVYNARSQGGVEKLGLDASRLETFQIAVSRLKDELEAEDFLDLDTFLYLIDGGEIELQRGPTDTSGLWWVNQGDSYAAELEGAYVWAAMEDVAGNLIHHHETVSRLQPGDRILHYANGAVRAVGKVAGPLEERTRPAREAAEEAGAEGYYVPVEYKELEDPLSLDSIPVDWREEEGGPFNRKGGVNQGYMYPLSREFARRLGTEFPQLGRAGLEIRVTVDDDYSEPPFEEIVTSVQRSGMKLTDTMLRRYHLALKTRGLVILSGVSGTGKTWLTQLYAEAVRASYRLVPVAPNWTSNEDLLGYYNPIDRAYYDTEFSRFLKDAAAEWERAEEQNRTPRPYHLALDEMNLARLEYYFARFLSAMEVRARKGFARIQLGPEESVTLPPNLCFVGTVNIDETTHGFADKVFDRAQVIELEAPRDLLWAHMGDAVYREAVMEAWDLVSEVAPFGFRVLDEIEEYVTKAEGLGVSWEAAVDEQLLQKVLPKLKGGDPRIGETLVGLIEYTGDRFPRTRAKAEAMQDVLDRYGFTSYF